MAEKIILGIDPGTSVMGYGLIRVEDSSMKLIAAGVVRMEKIKDHALKLKRIFERTLMLIDEFHPDEVAIESPFFGKNVQSMLKLGRAQGVAIAAALYRSVPVIEYTPKRIKLSITGHGNASKEQVAGMLQRLLSFKESPKYLDATDGLAAAVCHYFQSGVKKPVSKKGWAEFIASHPEKILK
jgi:crossover junction endodeoxyribonuclease RuvC